MQEIGYSSIDITIPNCNGYNDEVLSNDEIIYYVNNSADGDDGSSWENAFGGEWAIDDALCELADNGDREPHIVDVANFLNSMGADIQGPVIKRVARIVKWILFALALFWAASCLWQSAKGFLHENNSHEECSRAPEYADLVAGMVGRNLGYVATESRDLDPTDRERVVYMSWEISPGTVTPISPDMVPSWQGPLVGPAGATEEAEDRYEACGFYVMACNESAVLRSRVNFQPDPREDHAPMDMSFRSLLGVLVAMFMLLCAWLRLRGDGKTSVVTAAFALAVFICGRNWHCCLPVY